MCPIQNKKSNNILLKCGTILRSITSDKTGGDEQGITTVLIANVIEYLHTHA